MKLCVQWWRPVAKGRSSFRLEEIGLDGGPYQEATHAKMVDTSSAFSSVRQPCERYCIFLFRSPGSRSLRNVPAVRRSRGFGAISQSAAIRNGHAALTWALTRRSELYKDVHCCRVRASSPGRRFESQNVWRVECQNHIAEERLERVFVC